MSIKSGLRISTLNSLILALNLQRFLLFSKRLIKGLFNGTHLIIMICIFLHLPNALSLLSLSNDQSI